MARVTLSDVVRKRDRLARRRKQGVKDRALLSRLATGMEELISATQAHGKSKSKASKERLDAAVSAAAALVDEAWEATITT